MLNLLNKMLGKAPRRKVYAGRIAELNWHILAPHYANHSTAVDESDKELRVKLKLSRATSAGELLSVEDILLDVDVQTKNQIFEVVGRHFEGRHGIPCAQVIECLSEREKLGSTGLGRGVALPHARIKNLSHAMAAYVRLKMPILFESPDAKPVSDVLVLLVPEKATEQHLEILAQFAQMFGDPEFRERIRQCDDAAAVHRAFCDGPRV